MANEVKVITPRSFNRVAIETGVTTIEEAIKETGAKPEECVVRVDGNLVDDLKATLKGGETISAFATKVIATAGVKQGHGPEDEDEDDDSEDAEPQGVETHSDAEAESQDKSN